MGTDFTGGGFEELRRETEKLKADAARLRQVTQAAEASTVSDEAERRRLAERARQATSRSILEAETIVQRGAAAARTTGTVAGTNIRAQTGEMNRLSTAAARVERSFQNIRRIGPWSWARSALPLTDIFASMARQREIGAAAAPRGGPLSATGGPLRALNEQVGFLPATGAGGAPRLPTQQSMAQYQSGVARTATSHAVLNAQMERHGALSSEFIQQLARGNVSLRDFGNQLVVTGGKFGGWLLAGAGIFALLGTLGAVGGGAMAAADGVNQLKRVIDGVDTDAAQQGFRALGDEMNLPISEVAAAQYEMGKIFNDQAESLEAARIVLAAVKVGELDVATSSRYLTAITKGFNLEASNMTDVFGQINAAQNDFGLNIQDTLAGMASAAGAAKTLGGSTENVLAFFTAARQAAGVSGNVTGTAVQRMTTFLQQNREELRQFGIDVDRMDLNEILGRAFEIAPTLDRNELVKLSRSLMGTFYGPRVALPALGEAGQRAFNESLPTYMQAGEQTWIKELDTALQSPRETVLRIATELDQLGSALAQSGFFDLMLLGVDLLGRMLDMVGGLFSLFSSLPAPLRHSLMIVAQLYALFRLMRRFNIGSTLPGAPGRAFTNPRNAQNDAREALIVRRNELSNDLVGASAAVTRAELERTIAQERMAALTKREHAAVRDSAGTVGRTASVQGTAVQRRVAMARYDRAVDEARIRETAIARQLELDRQAEQQLRSQRPSAVAGLPYPAGPAGGATASRSADITRSMTSFGAELQRNISNQGIVLGSVNTAVTRVRTAASRLTAGARRISWSTATARLRQAGQSLRRGAEGLRGMISPMDVAIGAVTGIIFAAVQAGQRSRDAIARAESIRGAESLADIESQFEAHMRDVGGGTTVYEHLFTNVEENQQAATEEYERQMQGAADFRSAIERLARGDRLAPEERAALEAGTYEDVYEAMAQDVEKRIFQHRISMREGERIIDQLIRRVRRDPNIEDPRGLADSLRESALGPEQQEDVDAIRRRAELAAAQAPLYDPVRAARTAAQVARRVFEAVKRSGSTEERQQAAIEVAQAERAVDEAVNDRAVAAAEAEGALRLSRIRPENEIGRAQQTLENARRTLGILRGQDRSPDEIKRALAAVNDAENAVNQAVRDRAVAMVQIAAQMREANAPLYAQLVSERTAVWAAQRELAILQEHGATRQQIRQAEATLAGAERALALARNQRAQTMLELSGEIAVAQIDPENTVGIAQQTLGNAQRVYALVQSQGQDAEARQRAYLAVLQAEQQLQEAIEARAEAIEQARYDIAAARAERRGNDVNLARLAIDQAVDDLRDADTPEERLNARAALIRARTQRRDAIYQTEIEDIEFQADIGKMTVQEQIRAYQRLLSTLQLNRDMRRDIRRRIYALRQESEQDAGTFDLRVGDIRLPTYYEIKRAIAGGVGAGGQNNVNMKQENNYYVTGSNADEIVDKVASKNGDAGRRSRNMMRSAGLV